MVSRVTIDERGMVTIPEGMREALGLRAHDVIVLEETERGLLMRPLASGSIEMYTDERIEEFTRDDRAISDTLGLDERG